ncbi:hypothetical protein D3C71_234810 [compost metagenome]
MIVCKGCGMETEPHKSDPNRCDACVRAEGSRVTHLRQQNSSWIDVAKEAELELWERQPEETDREWQVWLAYRDAYPSVRPSFRLVAEQLDTTVNVVSKISSRWSFPVRLQAWANHCDELTRKKREEEIIKMNEQHTTMAAALNKKLAKAIEKIDPYDLSPKEIQGLMKVATDLERKARLDQPIATPVVINDDNPDLKSATLPTENLAEVIGILGAAGVLSNFGIRQTKTTTETTEVVVKDGD